MIPKSFLFSLYLYKIFIFCIFFFNKPNVPIDQMLFAQFTG